MTFFRVLRERPSELQQALAVTPYARSEFEHLPPTLGQHVEDELERARRWYARTRMAFACSATDGWGFEVDGAQRGGTPRRVVRDRGREPRTVRRAVPPRPGRPAATGANAWTATTGPAPSSTSTRLITPTLAGATAATATATTSTRQTTSN